MNVPSSKHPRTCMFLISVPCMCLTLPRHNTGFGYAYSKDREQPSQIHSMHTVDIFHVIHWVYYLNGCRVTNTYVYLLSKSNVCFFH
jgi:hypothetical protein